MILLDILASALAGSRMARMVSYEDGPAYLFERIRKSASSLEDTRLSWVPEGLDCYACTSFWLSVLSYALCRRGGRGLVYAIASSRIALTLGLEDLLFEDLSFAKDDSLRGREGDAVPFRRDFETAE